MRSLAAPEEETAEAALGDFVNQLIDNAELVSNAKPPHFKLNKAWADMPQAKWCREGRWENGLLYGRKGTVIHDPDQIDRENMARAAQDAQERAYRKFRLAIPTFDDLMDLNAS